jgi:hypothetical protein
MPSFPTKAAIDFPRNGCFFRSSGRHLNWESRAHKMSPLVIQKWHCKGYTQYEVKNNSHETVKVKCGRVHLAQNSCELFHSTPGSWFVLHPEETLFFNVTAKREEFSATYQESVKVVADVNLSFLYSCASSSEIQEQQFSHRITYYISRPFALHVHIHLTE